MVLTDRQRADLHSGIYEYLLTRGDAFAKVAAAFAEADPQASGKTNKPASVPLLEKKWTAIPRLQKKVLELERAAAQNAKIHAHRVGTDATGSGGGGGARRMLPRLPCSHTLKGHSLPIATVEVHPVFTVVVSGSEDGTIKVWDHESGEYIRTLKGHTNTVTSLSFSPSGSHLASASTDLSIKLWDFTTYACVRTLRGHDHTISSIRFIPKMTSKAIMNNNNDTAGETTSSGLDADAAGSQHLLSASRDKTVKVWDVETGFCDQTIADHGDWVRCLAVRQHDGGLFCSSGNDTVIQVYDGTNRKKVCELRGHEHVVESVSFLCESTSGNSKKNISKTLETARSYIASASRDRTVRLWNVGSVACIGVFRAHENWVRSVLIHPSGNYLISAGDDRTIRVMDIAAQRCLRTLDAAHPHFVSALSMHHTLPILVSGSVDTTLKCWMLD